MRSGVTRVGDTRGGNWGCQYPSIFSWKTWRLFSFATFAVSPLFIFLLKNWRPFFAHHCHFLLISLGCHPLPGGCRPAPFLPIRPRFPTIFCKFGHKIFFFGCHLLEGVTRGGPLPPGSLFVRYSFFVKQFIRSSYHCRPGFSSTELTNPTPNRRILSFF